MSELSTVLHDETRLSRLDRRLFRLEALLTTSAGAVILLLVFFATANVLGRWLFDLPISGYVDWVEQAMPFIAFLGISYTQRLGGHIRMDFLLGRAKGRALWALELVTVVAMLLICIALVHGSFSHFLRAWEIGDSSLDIDLPTWPAKLVVPVALTLMALRLLLQAIAYFRAFRASTAYPVAVPLVEDAATVAAREAESVMGGSAMGEPSR